MFGFGASAMALFYALLAWLEGGTSAVQTALVSSFTTVASDAQATMAAILPVAIPIVGFSIVVTLGIKIFRKVSGR